MSSQKPIRITSVMGVARALLATFSPDEAVEVLEIEFGWDVTFQALLLMRGEAAEEALLRTLEMLVTDELPTDLADVRRWPLTGTD